jgi:thimet oligopeptidase
MSNLLYITDILYHFLPVYSTLNEPNGFIKAGKLSIIKYHLFMDEPQKNPDLVAWVNWTPEEISQQVNKALEYKRQLFNRVKIIPASERNFENTVYAIEISDYPSSDCIGALEILMNMHPDESVRLASRNAIENYQNQIVDIEYDPEIYQSLKVYAEKNESLATDEQKLLTEMLRDYRRMGFDLPKNEQDTLKENIKELAQLETEFSQNINEYEDHITLAPLLEIGGLPQDYLERFKRDENGDYIVTLDYPDYFPFIQQADSAIKREELMHKYLRKGGERNMEILKRVLELRTENAKLLGYESHAAYVLETRMAKEPKQVDKFLEDLLQKAKSGLTKELEQLLKLKVEDTKNPEATLAYFDRSYYYRKLKKQKCNLDEELLKEYFSLEQTLEALFSLYSEIFSITITKEASLPVWHQDVTWYKLGDSKGEVLGYFVLDLYPRPNKYGHAAVFTATGGRHSSLSDSTYVTPVCALVCNFSKPTESTPSLLTHDEVETLFHEFGHVCHDLITKARFLSQSGTHTSRDFVEAPSQMLENWVWNPEILKRIGRHYKDQTQTIPDDLINALISSRFVDGANFVTGQVLQSRLDFILHTSSNTDNPAKIHIDLMREYFGLEFPDDAIFPAGFGHLMGYDSGYYGYLWSKVYASDMFTRFQSEGLLNQETGLNYRIEILEPGSSRLEIESVTKFLGRAPNSEAFFKDLGLT